MNKLYLIIFCICVGVLGIEVINDFSKLKTFYASFYPTEFFYRDTLNVNIDIPPNNSTNKMHWVFEGYCKSDKLKRTIPISIGIVENKEAGFNYHKIPIWRNTISKTEIIYEDIKINKPFSYGMTDYWTSPLFIILIIPSLFCYLKTKKK